MRPDPRDAHYHDRSDLLRRLYCEAYCFGLAFYFHDGNNHLRKAVTLMLVLVWGTVTVALSIDAVSAVEPPYYGVLTAAVFAIVGRIWNIEFNNFAEALAPEQDDDSDDTEGE